MSEEEQEVEMGEEQEVREDPVTKFFANLPSGLEESESTTEQPESEDLMPYAVNGKELMLPKEAVSLLEQGRRFQSEKDRQAAENAQLKAQMEILFKQQEQMLNSRANPQNQEQPQKSGLPPALAMAADKIGGATGFPDEFKALVEVFAEELNSRDSKILDSHKQMMEMLTKQQEILGHVSGQAQDQEVLRRGWEAVSYQANEEGLSLSQAEREAVATRFYQLQKMEGHSVKTQDTDFQMAWLEAERDRKAAEQPRIPRINSGVRPPAASPFAGSVGGRMGVPTKRLMDGLEAFRRS